MTGTGPAPLSTLVDHDVLHAMSPDGDPGLLEEVHALLGPLSRQLDQLPDAALDGSAPATGFNPFLAAGQRRHRTACPAVPGADCTVREPDCGDVFHLSARCLARRIRDGSLDRRAVLASFIRRAHQLQPVLNAFISTNDDAPGQSARHGLPGRLDGVPVAVKDLIDVAGVPSTCGSHAYLDNTPAGSADSWHLLESQGAVLLGKTNTHELAAGVTCDNDTFGPVKNPWDLRRMSGGSSGGSAAAVAAGLAPLALGTDTGGSIRIPASFCGVVGLKPTFGAASLRGVHPLAWSLDTLGPISRNVSDTALAHDLLCRSAHTCEPAAGQGGSAGLEGLRVGIPDKWLADGATPSVLRSFDRAVDSLRQRGATTRGYDALPEPRALTAVNRVIAYVEGSASHARLMHTTADVGRHVRARLEAGRYIRAETYLLSQIVRGRWCRLLDATWDDVDVLVTPTVPCVAPPLGCTTIVAGSAAPEPVGLALVRYTAPFSLAGVPALTLPTELPDGSLPTGIQIVGPPGRDDLVCYVAAALENELDLHLTPPDLGAVTGTCGM